MKNTRLLLPIVAMALSISSVSCDDDSSQIGNSLTEGNLTIYVDSLTFDLAARGVENVNYDARSGNLLLGSINVPDYGRLKSSFVSRMMCVTELGLPEDFDTSLIDSCQFVMAMMRGDIVGDSLAPQKVNVYRLDSQIPDNITNTFDPVAEFGYDKMHLLGTSSFTASAMGKTDSLFNKQKSVNITVDLGKEFATKIVTEYSQNPQYFQWPQSFAQNFLPGIFVETSFGRGCVSNIQAALVAVYYHTVEEEKKTEDDKEIVTYKNVPDTIIPFSISPEVLSSNNINFEMAQSLRDKVESGEIIITTPGGYNAQFEFPAQDIIKRYESEEHNLSLISQLSLNIPAEEIENEYGITVAPYLLLIKTSEVADFFNNNKLPDDITSFSASYDSDKKQYSFAAMRSYILNLLQKDNISSEDTDFSIIPVYLKQVTQDDYYGNKVTYTTQCVPFTMRPTMTRLHTEKAMVVFSFSSQKFD
ncbi:MAG: DUF4270 domain-containing protein [Muribaculaceae bacterium]|nr:DUF4270 domain-containing protein [Muribaculaceae bacterium]